MKPLNLNDRTGAVAVRALAVVGQADGRLDERERHFLELHAAVTGGLTDVSELEPIEPAECAEQIVDQSAREALIQRMVLMTLLDEKVSDEEVACIRGFARAFGVDEPAIHQMEMFQKGRIKLLAFDLLRRGFIGSEVKRAWAEQGLKGMVAAFRGISGTEDPELAAKYRALGDLAEGTLGRAYFEHCKANGFALPGEKEGAPELLRFHDVGHALTGYATDPPGEVRMGSFEAGYMGEDGFSVILLAMYVFHLGAELPKTQPSKGQFDVDAFVEAFARGQRCALDLRSWDPWPHFTRPLVEVRAELGLA